MNAIKKIETFAVEELTDELSDRVDEVLDNFFLECEDISDKVLKRVLMLTLKRTREGNYGF